LDKRVEQRFVSLVL